MAEKYLNLSGLQAFYDKLKTTAFIDSALDTTSTKPVQNAVVSQAIGAQGVDIETLKTASSNWDKISGVSALSGIKAYKTITVNTTAITANNSGANITLTGGGNIAFTADATNRKITISARDTNKIADMSDNSTYFSSTSALYALSATSATNAANITNTAIKVASATSATQADKLKTARNIAASGDVEWSVSFNGTTGVTGNATIKSVPWAAISSHRATVISSNSASDTKFATPKAVNDAITAALNTKASFKGPESSLTDFTTPYDKTAIYLVGPTGTGADKYKEYVVTGTAGTTADFLQIGDTSTDLSDYLKTTAFNNWTTSNASTFSGKASSAVSAENAGKLGGTGASTIITSAKAGSAASAWITTNGGITGIKSFNTINASSGTGTVTAITAGSSGASWNLKVAGVMSITADTATNTITLSSRDNNSTAFIPSGQKISGIYGTTTGEYFLSALKLNAGSNITFTSASNSQLTINATQPSVGNGTIKITTGASPASGQFTVNQSTATTITLGSMALAQTSSYMATGSMVPYTSAEVVTGITW